MKKIVTMSLATLLASATIVGCTKDRVDVDCLEANQTQSILVYSIDGVSYTAMLHSESEIQSLYETLLALVKSGHVVIINDNGTDQLQLTKDVKTFSSKDEVDVIEWAKTMTSEGYSVRIDYDADNGVYVGTAYKKD